MKKIKVRFAESGASRFPEEERKAGFFYYELRNHDEGTGYNVEDYVLCNNIGSWVTDYDVLQDVKEPRRWLSAEDIFKKYDMVYDATLVNYP